MQPDAGYALQKLKLSIDILTTGAGDIKDRIKTAHKVELYLVREVDIPEALSVDWKTIKTSLTKKGPKKNESGEIYVSAINNTLYRMHNRTLSKIVEDIISFTAKLEAHLKELS